MPPRVSKGGSKAQWRKVHRWLSITAAILFLSVSITGIVLQVEQIFGSQEAEKEKLATMVSPLSLRERLPDPSTALDEARKLALARFGNRPVSQIDWQIKGQSQHFILHLDGPEPLRVDVDSATNTIVDSRPDGEDWLLQLHTGEILGDGGKFLGLGWGVALFTMIVTGFVIYVQMYRSRQKGRAASSGGRRRYFW